MSETSERIEEYSHNSENTLDEFVEILHVLIENAKEITSDNEKIGYELAINMAKLDHMAFKNHTYSSVISGQINNSLSDHKECNFGKWYDDNGKKQFSNNPLYKNIDTPHKKIHKNIAKAMKMLNNGNTDEIIELFKDTEVTSKELFQYLDNMVKQS
jgi:methyl-accepting chemotaxis protein